MIAIITRYMPATDTRGARYRATWEDSTGLRTATVPADYSLDSADSHLMCARTATGDMWLPGRRFALIASAPAPGGKGWVHIAQEVEQ